jgi:chemotaxis protein CheC
MNFLQEMAQLGAEQAAVALSTMLELRVSVNTLRAVQLTLPEIAAVDTAAAARADFVGVYFTLHGQQPGRALVIFSEDHAGALVHVVRGERRAGPALDDLGMSAIAEIGNVIAGAFFAAARKFVQFPLIHSVPRVVADAWKPLVGLLTPTVGRTDESLALLECELAVERINARCFLMIVVGKWTE